MKHHTPKEKVRKSSKKSPNFLPPHVCASFEQELKKLVSSLPTEGAYSELSLAKNAYLQQEFLSKYLDEKLVPADVRRAAAVTKWLAVENRNLRTNHRIRFLLDEEFGWSSASKILDFARKKISKVLRPAEVVLFDETSSGGTFTNGASTRVKRSSAAAIQKHSGEAHVSSLARPLWERYSACTILADMELKAQESSVMFTVPKKTDIDRVACKEPEINMFLQRLAGEAIRNDLRKVGINLRDQSVNQRAAQIAYETNQATIDLSSASDSISIELVRALLPNDWFSLLDDLRVHTVNIDGTEHRMEMFSSMGNGFTFELESLLFWALTCAVSYFTRVKGPIKVYGDDIVCPAKIGPRLMRVFHYFGFRINDKKSNWSGPLRESCGEHFHRGRNITPFYLGSKITSKSDVIKSLNQLLKWDNEETDNRPVFTIQEVGLFHQKWSRIIPSHLWGGTDLSSISQLVTGDLPRKRLLRRTEPVEYDNLSGLKYWLTVKNSRSKKGSFLQRVADHLECDPRIDTSYYVADVPPWWNHTAWDPYDYLT